MTGAITTQGDTATQCVLLLPRDLDLDLALLSLPLSRETDLGRLLDVDRFLSPRLQDLLEDLLVRLVDLVTDLVLREDDLETLRDGEGSLRFSAGSLAPVDFRATSRGGGWLFFFSSG